MKPFTFAKKNKERKMRVKEKLFFRSQCLQPGSLGLNYELSLDVLLLPEMIFNILIFRIKGRYRRHLVLSRGGNCGFRFFPSRVDMLHTEKVYRAFLPTKPTGKESPNFYCFVSRVTLFHSTFQINISITSPYIKQMI